MNREKKASACSVRNDGAGWSAGQRREADAMKVVYNWLKDFVEVPATAEELASRLALSGTNIGGVEKNVQGGVIDAEVTSNRPDCLGLLGIAREVGAIYKTP